MYDTVSLLRVMSGWKALLQCMHLTSSCRAPSSSPLGAEPFAHSRLEVLQWQFCVPERRPSCTMSPAKRAVSKRLSCRHETPHYPE